MNKNKKALVIGGSNGIGLAIVNNLIKKNYEVIIADICQPNEALLSRRVDYIYCNLLDMDDQQFRSLSENLDIEIVMITVGVGRTCNFEFLSIPEIEKTVNLNTTSVLKLVRIFYDRIKSNDCFYFGIMGSIAGLVSSPVFSVYSASKSALCRFVESVNVELEMSGTGNRILNVSPGSIKGTKFNGGENDLSLTASLANDIVSKLLSRETLFIPEYEKIYSRVINRYQENPHEFGVNSYQYKMKSGRVRNESNFIVGYLSGTFDLFHIGHLNLLRRAKEQCDYLIVGVHPDASHKGKETFIPFEERMEIIKACKYVDRAVVSCKEDSDAWEIYRYNRLFVGSDYKGTERFNRYEEFFKNKNAKIIYFPYTQGTNRTQIRKLISKQFK